MPKGSVSRLRLRQLEDLFQGGIAGDRSDGELLDQFLRCRDSVGHAAFRALVERHGPMVFRVCRRALNDHHAAQDALQATFLVLARHAGTIRNRDSVSSWLFGVARRAAARLRMEKARQECFESCAAERSLPLTPAQHESAASDSYPELHEEIARLPEKYRLPILLCYFEGLTHEQAATLLRWPVGTVKIRLSRARDRLRAQLEKTGHSPLPLLLNEFRPGSVGELPEHVVQTISRSVCRYATTGIGGELVSSTVIKLTQGVMKSMLMHKLRLTAVVLPGLILVGFGAVVAAQRARDEGAAGEVLAATGGRDDSPSTLQLAGMTELVPDMIVKIRPRFDCRVDRVLVGLGQTVKKGDPLVEIFSGDLAEARNSYEAAASQWARDKNSAAARLKAAHAREQLLVYGLSDAEIDSGRKGDGVEKATMILRSHSEGVVITAHCCAGKSVRQARCTDGHRAD